MPLKQAGYVPTGTSLGVFLGRLLLSDITHRFLGGEHIMITIYCAILLGLQLVAWLVPSAIATSVAFSLIGFFSATFFPSGMQIASELMPRKVKASGLGLIFVMAQLGGSVFPAVTGVLATKVGVNVLQPIAVGLVCATGISWFLVPIPRRNERR
jgi:fucose permease